MYKQYRQYTNFYSSSFFSSSMIRPVVPGGAEGAMAPPYFGRSVNPISTRGSRLCSHITTGTPGSSELPTALTIDTEKSTTSHYKRITSCKESKKYINSYR